MPSASGSVSAGWGSRTRVEPLLRMKSIVKAFSGVRVLHGVDFEVLSGEVMALVGENGAGKSTLMKILAGVHTDWEGEVCLDGEPVRFPDTRAAEEAGIAIIYQELNLVPGLTVAENIFLGREPTRFGGVIDYAAMNRMAREIMDSLHFDAPATVPVSELRIGARQLVEIGKALSLDARLLIMDEPTSALTGTEAEVLFSVVRELRAGGVSVIYISHRLDELYQIADRVTVMRDGLTVDTMPASEIDRRALISLMVGREFEQFFVKEGEPGEDVVFRVRSLTRLNGVPGRRALLDDISFDVRRGEQFGIAGLLGSGRTELLEALFGAAARDTSGRVELEGVELNLSNPRRAIEAGIALLTEDRKGNGLVLSMNVEQNLTLAALNELLHLCMISPGKERALAKEYVDRLSIDAADLGNPIESLSGGNQQKVLLAKWLATRPRVLLLDEPTRGVDVGAKHELYVYLSKLAAEGVSIIMTSSELPELLSICDRIMVLREGRMSALFDRDEATQARILHAAAPAA